MGFLKVSHGEGDCYGDCDWGREEGNGKVDVKKRALGSEGMLGKTANTCRQVTANKAGGCKQQQNGTNGEKKQTM